MRKIVIIIAVCFTLTLALLSGIATAREPALPKFGWDKDFAYITNYMGEYYRNMKFGAEIFDYQIEKRRPIKNPPPDKDYTGNVRYIESVFGYPFEYRAVFYHDALASQSYTFESEPIDIAEVKRLAAKLIEAAGRYMGGEPDEVFEKEYLTGNDEPSPSWFYNGQWESDGERVSVEAFFEAAHAQISIAFANTNNPFTALITKHRDEIVRQTPPAAAQRSILPELNIKWGMGLNEVYANMNRPASIVAYSGSPMALVYGIPYDDKEVRLQYQFNNGLSDIGMDVRGKADFAAYNALLDYLENTLSRRFDTPRQTVLKRNTENRSWAMFTTISKWNHPATFVYMHSNYNQKDESYTFQIQLFDRLNPANKDEIKGMNRHWRAGFPLMRQLVMLQRYMFTPWKF